MVNVDDISIRPVQPDDGPRFREIRLEAIADSPAAFGSSLEEIKARPNEYWSNRVASAAAGADNVLFAAEAFSSWVGIAGAYTEGKTGNTNPQLIAMWVHPAVRRKGIARRLVKRVVDWARQQGASQVALWVTEGNASARSLYNSCGFVESGERKTVPSHSELSELEMVLKL